jgi:hypothetical protein
MIELTQETE